MKKYILIAFTALALGSCTFLDEHTTTSLTDTYGTEAALEANIRGIQSSLSFFTKDYPENLESCSGLVQFGSTNGRVEDNRWKCIVNNMTYTSMSLNIELYGNIYTAINNCNVLLQHLPESPVDEAYKREIEAECKMYRALVYLAAVRLYGDIPLALESNETSFHAIPRTSYYKVYDQIVYDLKDAWEGMRDPARVAQLTPTQGRSNKWAARALLSAVYLQIASLLEVDQDPSNFNFYDESRGERRPVFEADEIGTDKAKAWKLCYDTATDVIENGPYALATAFKDLYRWKVGYLDARGRDCWNLDERIITVQSEVFSTNNYTATRSLPAYPPDVEVEVNWASTDISRPGNVRPSRFFFNEWCRRYAWDKGCKKDSLYKACADPRIDVALIYDHYIPCNSTTVTRVYPSVSGSNQANYLPYFRKYNTPTYQGKPDVADFYYMRFAEIYYIAAEAAMHTEAGAIVARDLVNEVHRRGGTPLWEIEQVSVDNIVWDKLFELCGEGHSYYEVRRLGGKWFKENILQARNFFFGVMGDAGENYMTTFFGRSDFRYDFADDDIKIRGALLCEFPKEELTANPAMSTADKNDFSRE
jgi:hypothetical protein